MVLTVHRDQGLVGRVSVVALITDRGAVIDQDFIGTNLEVSHVTLPCNSVTIASSQCSYIQEIVFMSGDSQEDIVINVVDDAVPELNEVFCVSLVLPEGGAVVGEIPEGIY